LKAITEAGLRDLTVTGTCFEYGMQSGCLTEETPAIPANSYAIAKDTLRKMMEILNSNQSFNFKWIRLFYMYGKGQAPSSLFTQLDKAIEQNASPFNMSGGEQIRDFLSVEKVVEHICQIAFLEANIGVVNCCSGAPQTVKTFVENYLKERGVELPLNLGYYPYPTYEPMEFWGGVAKLKSILTSP